MPKEKENPVPPTPPTNSALALIFPVIIIGAFGVIQTVISTPAYSVEKDTPSALTQTATQPGPARRGPHPFSLRGLCRRAVFALAGMASVTDAFNPPQSRPSSNLYRGGMMSPELQRSPAASHYLRHNPNTATPIRTPTLFPSLPSPLLTHQTFPYASTWQIAEASDLNSRMLLNWTAAADPMYPFYKNLPDVSPSFLVGPNRTHPGGTSNTAPELAVMQPQVVPVTGYGALNTPAQMEVGLQDSRHYFTSWWIRLFIYFGGSHSAGQVLAPSPEMIRAAHRNGANITGTVFFSTDSSESAWIDLFLTPDANGDYPYALKLIEIARAYHFDGYFMNEESVEFDKEVDARFLNFFQYFHKKAPDLILSWYQVPADSVDTTFIANATSRSNLPLFLDYGAVDSMNAWVQAADQVGCPRAIVTLGSNVESAPRGADQKPYLDGMKTLFHSVSLFDISQTILNNTQNDPPAALAAQLMHDFWEGNPKVDPDWGGVQAYVNRYSALQKMPFYTGFSTGFGEKFFIDGTSQFASPWHSMGIQDYLPTWEYDLQQIKSSLTATYNFTDAYSGANSLHYQGALAEQEVVMSRLFATRLSITPGDQMEVTFKSSSTDPAASLCLEFADGKTTCFDLNQGNRNTWRLNTFPLNSHAGKEIQMISLRILSTTSRSEYSLQLGQLYLGAATPPPSEPGHFRLVGEPGKDEAGNWHLWATWDFDSNVAYYDLYTTSGQGSTPVFLLRTFNNIADFDVGPTLPEVISVEAVNPRGGRSAVSLNIL